jgi:ABC-type multidrug transport system permease subunit
VPPLAHVGHWAIWVLYAIPVVIVLGSIVFTLVRDRRGRHAERAAADPNV